MANLNKVFLIGNLTRDPELRYTPSGTAVADLDLATSRKYSTKSGDDKEEVCYVRIVTWGRQAETCGEYLGKGSPIFVEGRLQLDSWETEDGQKRNKLKVQAQRVQFLGKTKKGSDSGSADMGSLEDQRIDEMASAVSFDDEPMDDGIPF